MQPFRDAAIKVGGWGNNQTEPEQEAAFVAGLIGQHGLEFYFANAEAEYEAFKGDASRSARFAEAFRVRLPELPAAVSSYGRAIWKPSTGRPGAIAASTSCRRRTTTNARCGSRPSLRRGRR